MKKIIMLALSLVLVFSSSALTFAITYVNDGGFGNVVINATDPGGGGHVHLYSKTDTQLWTSETHTFIHHEPITDWPIPMSCSYHVTQHYYTYTCRCGDSYDVYRYSTSWGDHDNTLCPQN